MKTIQLTKGQVAIVDDEDYEWLNQQKWYAIWNPCTKNYKVARMCWCPLVKQEYKIYMSRQIMSCPQGLLVDHQNHNPLDNRKSNLRICTQQQNNRNRLPNKNSTSSRYKGVCFAKTFNKWMSYICFNNKLINLGYFHSEIEAAKTYDKKAKELFGEFALTNF